MPEEIKFYKVHKPYGALSNFAPTPFMDQYGFVWKTSEHYYQAAKFGQGFYPDAYAAVLEAETPGDAARHGRAYKLSPEDLELWEQEKEKVMCEALRMKFLQNWYAFEVLHSTGDSVIIEDSPTDYYWGCGADGTGKNRLGHCLMKIRKEIREYYNYRANRPTKEKAMFIGEAGGAVKGKL